MLRNKKLRLTVQALLLLAGFTVLTFIYIYPGGQPLLEGSNQTFLSDGTDPTATSYMYDMTIETWKTHPSRLFYGAVYTDIGDPVNGNVFWMPLSERWLVLLHANFFPLEQLSTAYIATLFLITALSIYLLCAYLGWSLWISLGLAIAWAFNSFTLARAKVHGAMVGLYHLPLIFLGLLLIVRGRSWRSLVAASFALLLAATTAHYFLVMAIFLSPFFMAFLFFQPEFKAGRARVCKRFALAVLPAILLLGANFYFALPDDARTTGAETMSRDTFKNGETHPYLRYFAAHPIDYLGGNLFGPGDLNPLRAEINEYILANLGMGNPHERSNGIRWTILLLSGAAIWYLSRGKLNSESSRRANVIYFLIFAVFTFWLSLSPDFPAQDMGPSYWLHRFVPKIRVPNRSAIHTHFALLMIAGFFLSSLPRLGKSRWLALFPLLVILDLPPILEMPMAPVLPRYEALQREKGPCGVGMTVPFFNPYYTQIDSYQLSQRLRGSNCMRLDQSPNVERITLLWNNFPATVEFVNSLATSPAGGEKLARLANCVPLTWIGFHPAVPRDWVVQFCQRMGWTLHPDLTCVAPNPQDRPYKNVPENCIR